MVRGRSKCRTSARRSPGGGDGTMELGTWRPAGAAKPRRTSLLALRRRGTAGGGHRRPGYCARSGREVAVGAAAGGRSEARRGSRSVRRAAVWCNGPGQQIHDRSILQSHNDFLRISSKEMMLPPLLDTFFGLAAGGVLPARAEGASQAGVPGEVNRGAAVQAASPATAAVPGSVVCRARLFAPHCKRAVRISP
jgi:hypothetical protein